MRPRRPWAPWLPLLLAAAALLPAPALCRLGRGLEPRADAISIAEAAARMPSCAVRSSPHPPSRPGPRGPGPGPVDPDPARPDSGAGPQDD